jgi:hypothetical protein
MDQALLERLRRLEKDLGSAYDENVDLRRAAEDPEHPRNRWPAIDRRASARNHRRSLAGTSGGGGQRRSGR